MSISAYETRIVTQAYEQVKPPTAFLRDMFFGNVRIFGTKHVDVDVVEKTRRKAEAISRGGAANIIDEKGYTTYTYTPPLLADSRIVGPAASMERLPGESLYSPATPQERMRAKGLAALQEFGEAFTRTEEYQAYEALFLGYVNLPNGVTVSFGQSDDLLDVEIDTQWGESSATPLADIFEVCETIHQSSGATPDTMVLGKTAMQRFFADDEIQTWFDKTKMSAGQYVGSPVPNGGKYLGTVNVYGYVLDVFSYYAWYDVSGTDTAYMPATKALIIDKTARRDRLYGAVEANNALQPALRYTDMWEQKNPDGWMYRMMSAPLMAAVAADSWATIQTTVSG